MIERCPPQQQELVLEYLNSRFGLDRTLFDVFALYAGPNGRIFLGPQTKIELSLADTTGLLIARIHKTVKPSTDLFQTFGKYVTRNAVTLTKKQTQRYIGGEDVQLQESELGGATNGYVMLAYQDNPLACGLLKGNRIENVLPKVNRLKVEHL
jgi:NOL1/NOP2/fmu family ribosome biogenesis protein